MTLNDFAGVDNHLRELKTQKPLDHSDYMHRIIKKLSISNIKPYIPYDLKTLLKCYKKGDTSFHATNITTWENAGGFYRSICSTGKLDYCFNGYGLGHLLYRNGINVYSVSETVCILKAVARMLCEKEIEKQYTAKRSKKSGKVCFNNH